MTGRSFVEFTAFFPDKMTAEEACARIEAEMRGLKSPRQESARTYQRVMRLAVNGYISQARRASSEATKWRRIAEAVYWWAAAFSSLPDKPFCQEMGAIANRTAKANRVAEAWQIYRAADPKTGIEWPSKEACKRYLMATKGWSRSSCNEYLKDENEV